MCKLYTISETVFHPCAKPSHGNPLSGSPSAGQQDPERSILQRHSNNVSVVGSHVDGHTCGVVDNNTGPETALDGDPSSQISVAALAITLATSPIAVPDDPPNHRQVSLEESLSPAEAFNRATSIEPFQLLGNTLDPDQTVSSQGEALPSSERSLYHGRRSSFRHPWEPPGA